jgi:hypothetical protein
LDWDASCHKVKSQFTTIATTARSQLSKNQIFSQVHHLKEKHNQLIDHQTVLKNSPSCPHRVCLQIRTTCMFTVTKWRLCVILTTTRLLKGPLVKFTVGGDGSEVWVSEPMLRTKSTYFDKALGGTTTEKRKAVMLEKESLGPSCAGCKNYTKASGFEIGPFLCSKICV